MRHLSIAPNSITSRAILVNSRNELRKLLAISENELTRA